MSQLYYRDQYGTLYPQHQALLVMPGLTPGKLIDGEFVPLGNPKAQSGVIVSEVDETGASAVLSGLEEDKGAHEAPLNGVAGTGFESEPEETDAVVDSVVQESPEEPAPEQVAKPAVKSVRKTVTKPKTA